MNGDATQTPHHKKKNATKQSKCQAKKIKFIQQRLTVSSGKRNAKHNLSGSPPLSRKVIKSQRSHFLESFPSWHGQQDRRGALHKHECWSISRRDLGRASSSPYSRSCRIPPLLGMPEFFSTPFRRWQIVPLHHTPRPLIGRKDKEFHRAICAGERLAITLNKW